MIGRGYCTFYIKGVKCYICVRRFNGLDQFSFIGVCDVVMNFESTSSSCICWLVGEEERMVSLSIMSRFVVSVRLGIMLGMLPWGMWCFAEVWNSTRPCYVRKVAPKDRKIPPLHACTSPSLLF